jgi:hypothetical protein
MDIRFHDEDGQILWSTSVWSKRATLHLSKTEESEAKPQEDYFTLLMLGLGSCILSFVVSMAWCRRRKSQSELNEDLMMDAQVDTSRKI